MARDDRPRRGAAKAVRSSRRCAADAGGARAQTSLYEEVTGKVIAELEAGRFPWVQPWDSGSAAIGMPTNAATTRPYSGINILLLWSAVIARGYPRQSWLTFRQALAAGGNVRKGEAGVAVYYADRFIPAADKARAEQEGCEAAAIPFLKRFTLFNVAQCDGLRDALVGQPPRVDECEKVPAAEALIAATGADFRVAGPQAFYSPAQDFVAVPPQSAFFDPVNYYRTALHELGHWTGHETRLNRDQSGPFGSQAYAREELVAELAAAFTCASLGIRPTVRHADYLGAWLAVLRADNRAIFKAARLASQAADYLLAFHNPIGGEAKQ
ncbi:ArdC family protein [Allosphingosinicella vermicomposti]|uniref:ArdC family protein n=1 Tax=Allosphingosinicella vermicomposti TaxID=614671 RepID=UPI000D0FF712|nr:zincin-like metallopeptidase domain-containing protein [Allosphingosinicella vermicomposti]